MLDDEPFAIFVHHDRTHVLSGVTSSTRVEAVMGKLVEKLCVYDASLQRGGQVLEPSCTLQECRITRDSEVQLVVRLRAGGSKKSKQVHPLGDDEGNGDVKANKGLQAASTSTQEVELEKPDASAMAVIKEFEGTLLAPELAVGVDLIYLCDAVRLSTDRAVVGQRSETRFEARLETVIEALSPFVGKPPPNTETEAAVVLLDLARTILAGVGAGPRPNGARDLYGHAAKIATLRRSAARAALVQVRAGSSPAEQGMHLALLESALRTLRRPPGHTAKVGRAMISVGLSVIKSAATMSLDPALLSSLRDVAQFTGALLSSCVRA